MVTRVKVVVFDFDGTLSASDSYYEFIKYCFAHSIRPWLFLPIFIFGTICCGLNRRSMWARHCMRCFLSPKMVKRLAPVVIKKHLSNRFGWALDQVARERAAGNICILISAGPDYLIPDLVSDMGFDVILTSKMDAKHPWRYKFMCWGPNKVTALKNWASRHNFIPNIVRAYGDSDSDKHIMALANTQVWINRKTGLPR